MEAKEKAKELVNKMYQHQWRKDTIEFRNAKQCALICVEEVRNFHEKLFYASNGSLFDKYLDDVKQEIEKL